MKIINTGDYEHSIVIDDQRCREKMLGGKDRYYRWGYSK